MTHAFMFLAFLGVATARAQENGTIVAWGANSFGQCNVPGPDTGSVAIATGGQDALGLRIPAHGACCHTDGSCAYGIQDRR
jgi:hypothetical protein